MKSLAEIAGCLALGSALIPTTAEAKSDPFLAFGEAADAPVGYVEMCERDVSSCGSDETETTGPEACWRTEIQPLHPAIWCAVDYDMAVPTGGITLGNAESPVSGRNDGAKRLASPEAMIRKVNADVNRRVLQVTDRTLFGVDELWRPAGAGEDAAGDCEDIALQKRNELIAAGFPADQLFFAVVYRADVGLHTVLLARLAQGDFVLDSMTSRLRRWHTSDYRWIRLQVPGAPMAWARIAKG